MLPSMQPCATGPDHSRGGAAASKRASLVTAARGSPGRIHWAGAETAAHWNGYFDGAVRSGEDAATAVLSRL